LVSEFCTIAANIIKTVKLFSIFGVRNDEDQQPQNNATFEKKE